MSDLTADSQEFHRLADRQDSAAAEATQSSADSSARHFKEQLWATHGAISGPSNNVFGDQAELRKQAGAALEEACNTLAAALRVAAASYAHTDEGLAADLNTQLHH
ncbi:MAG: ESX-1 secretion-associated protein [Mycobacteriaceae bacterium]|nr:ESX-1 secretion-associated protein [Mycobacteriaceae bacterium]